jgi:HK97 gp10 family phage protein
MSDIKGMPELLAQIEKLKGIKTNKSLLAGAMKLESLASPEVPVKIGYLRSSPESTETDNGAQLVYTAEYAYYVHNGTSKQAGNPWITRTIDEHSEEIVKAVGDQIEKEIGGSI